MDISPNLQRFLDDFAVWEKRRLEQPYGSCKQRSEVPLPNGYTIIDVETTGTNRETDRVIEIAVSRCDADGKAQQRFQSYVDPVTAQSSAEAIAVHGITAEKLAHAPRFSELIDTLTPLLDGNVFTAFNCDFDLTMVQQEFQRAKFMYQPPAQACLLKAYRWLEPELESHKLESWAAAHNIDFDPHEAGEDVRVSEMLLQDVIARGIAPESIELNEDLWIRRMVEREPDKPASEKSVRYLFVLARKVGWTDGSQVQSGRVKALCEALNGCQLDEMTALQQARMVDAFTFLAIRKRDRERRKLQQLASELNGAPDTPQSDTAAT